ncbi:MAG: ABC transporter substrate-binding protein [Bacteroidetes bacterium]|jgi:ABC-type transport system substrate-binding protein|nr:ABC transporter substrate-binding protein [Bacteroidota bacterium]MBT6686851.1 ABC transporter substrate-binding protein [Bacteroidota bacterium]MBT7144180.1 ABC transporter substrate-binding protein [Bacteroidota bacterium]MBT7491899.1 ABC transporter substrate-binding protein [Bacteroidota bacterium]
MHHKINYIIFILLSITFSNCSNEISQDKRKVFRYNESKGIATLDPAFAKNQTIIWANNQLFNGLVKLDDSLNIVPCIAKNWEITENGKLYRFFLRKDVFFHKHKLFLNNNTRKVVASDFVFSLNRIIDTDVASPGAWIFNNVDKHAKNTKNGFSAPNDTTIEIILKTPFPAFLGLLSMQYCSVVPKEIVAYYGEDFRENPIGTGPFKFKYWKEGEKLIFIKNENYFETDFNNEKLPYLDAISISFINDKQSEFLEFIKGNLDFLSSIDASYKDELITRNGMLNQKYSDRIAMIKQAYLNSEYLGFMLDTNKISFNNILRIKEIRQAINYGFDRKKMIRYLRNNIGIPANAGFVPKGMANYSKTSVNGYKYDPKKAQELLDSAGFPNGTNLPTITLTTTSSYIDLCEYIQHQLSQIGVKIKIEIGTGASFLDMVANSKLEFFRGSWIADYPDPENYMALFYSKNHSPNGPNYTHFNNPEFDSLYEKAMNELNDSVRFQLYKTMDQIIIDEAIIVPLFYDESVRFISKNVKGMRNNPLNLLNLLHVNKTNN